MKNQLFNSILTTAIMAVFLSVSAITPSFAQQKSSTPQQLFNEGIKLFKKNQFDQALVNFEEVLKRSPSSVYARAYIGKCKEGIAQSGIRSRDILKKKLQKVIIPNIAFKDAPIGDVLDYLSQRTVELTNNKVSLNFIYKGTSEQRANTLVTLSLRSVPVTDAINYVGQITHTAMKYEEHAVIADPNGHVTTASAASTGTADEKSEGKNFPVTPKKSPFDN